MVTLINHFVKFNNYTLNVLTNLISINTLIYIKILTYFLFIYILSILLRDSR